MYLFLNTGFWGRSMGHLVIALWVGVYACGPSIAEPLPTKQAAISAQQLTVLSQQITALSLKNFAQRTVRNILFNYQQAGYTVIYSDSLVAQNLVALASPPAGEPIVRLQQLLAHYQLGLEPMPAQQSAWLLVRKKADTTVKLTLRDALTNTIIHNATVSIDQLPVAPVNAGELNKQDYQTLPIYTEVMQQLQITHPQYKPHYYSVAELTPATTVYLTPYARPATALEEILVTASAYRWQKATGPSQQTLNNVDVQLIPTRGNDPVQALASLPGVATSGVSAKPNIRGGASDELLILFDGIELYDPFHLKDFQGLLSGINGNLVKNMTVYTGGYPAHFGSKMSGVLDIEPIEPSGEYGNNFEFNPIFNALTLSQHFKNPTDYVLFATRRGHLETVLSQLETNIGAPRFNDSFLKYHWQAQSGAFYEAAALSIRDDIELNNLDDEQQEGESAKSIYNSQYAWLKRKYAAKNYDSEWLWVTSYSKNERQGWINDPKPSGGVGFVDDYRNFLQNELKASYVFAPVKETQWELGGALKYAQGHYAYNAQAWHGPLAVLVGGLQNTEYHLTQTPSGFAGNAFVSARMSLTPEWLLETGLRADGQNYTGHSQHQLSPRLASRFELNNAITLKASAGRFYQAPNIQDLDITSGQINYYAPQKSDHYILGVDLATNSSLVMTLEVYTKKIFSPKPQYENLFNPYVLLPELAADRIYIVANSAQAQGAEARLEYAPALEFKTWASFAFGEAEDLIGGKQVRRSWNQVRALHLGAIWDYTQWSLSAQLHWHSGWPSTQMPSSVNGFGTPVDIQRNQSSFPDYISFDIHINRQWQLRSSLLEAYLDVINLPNRRNIGFYNVEIAPDTNTNGYSITRQPETLFSIVPVLGVRWHF